MSFLSLFKNILGGVFLGEKQDDIIISHKGNDLILTKDASILRMEYSISVNIILSSAYDLYDPRIPVGTYTVFNQDIDSVFVYVKSGDKTVRLIDIKYINIINGNQIRSNEMILEANIEAIYFKQYSNGNKVYLSNKIFDSIKNNLVNPTKINFGDVVYEDGLYCKKDIENDYITEFLVEDGHILVLDFFIPDVEILGFSSNYKNESARRVI